MLSPSTTSHNIEVVGTVLLDKIANDLLLGPGEIEQLRFLLAALGDGLSLPDVATRVYMLAVQLADVCERRRLRQRDETERLDIGSVFNDLKIRLADTFHLTEVQKASSHDVLIIEPRRTSFSGLAQDLIEKFEINRDTEAFVNLRNVFIAPSRIKVLNKEARSVASSVRNSFRNDIVMSIKPKIFCDLADFVKKCVRKYKNTTLTTLNVDPYTVQLALLRRFVYDHPEIVNAAVDSDDIENEDPSTSEERPAKRARAGRTAKGEDFWGRVEEWFKKEMAVRGSNWTSASWKRYIDQVIVDDRVKFVGVKPGSPVIRELPETPIRPMWGEGLSSAGARSTESTPGPSVPESDPFWSAMCAA
ncbi:unnamed protein product [Mycena citricolor]|uniref:Uncharacterized protein n=1 Tax=Mycena citricolor TaxID=2018698 RepID=A0AAD2HAJ8_9AGAR|nr:unnamed protein product [Mycena citricolor]